MATGLVSWSTTPANNATADANVNFAEGQAPSSLNDSDRGLMASMAKWRDDNNASLVTGGTSTAYTLTTNQVFASLSAMNRQSIRIFFHTTCGASPTLNVDGLGAKAINTVIGTAVGTGTIIGNRAYDLVYDNSNSVWVVCGGENEQFASGTIMLFNQTAAPTGWTKLTSTDNAALRLTTGAVGTGGSTGFTSVFASRTILQTHLPNYNLAISLAADAHSTGISAATTSSYIVDGGTSVLGTGPTAVHFGNTVSTAVTITDPNHTHTVSGSVGLNGGGTGFDFAVLYVDVIAASKA
jgi:hypothetical protein